MSRVALCLELPAGSAPDWVELIPRGPRVVGRDGRHWLFDESAQRDVLAAYRSRAVPLVLDREHATQHRAPVGEEAPAAAWIEKLEVREGALWGLVQWTPRGAEQVTQREYRFVSPVFDYDPSTTRIARLVSAGLTNTPNLHLSALNSEEEPPMKLSAAIAQALGLGVDATEEAGLAAIAKLKAELSTAQNREAVPSLDRFVPRTDYDAAVVRATNAEQQLKDRDAAAHTLAVDAEIDAALKAGKITPAAVDYHRATCSDHAGLERFRKYVGVAPIVADVSGLGGKKAGGSGTALNAEEQAVCERVGITPEQFQSARAA